jgi:uncharacterized protein
LFDHEGTIIMKRLSLFVAILASINLYTWAGETPLPHITVYGTAITDVVPDEMLWSVQIRIVRQSPEDASAEEAKAVKEVLSFLKQLRVDDKRVQMSQLQFGENREYSSSSWVKSGYYAKTDVAFKLTDFSQYQKLWTGLAKISGVSVESTSYDDSKRIEHRKETRKKALEAAREKAVEMAGILESQIQEPLEVEEDMSVNQWQSGNNNRNSVQNDENQNTREDGQLALGTIPIQVRVKVSFRLLTTQK